MALPASREPVKAMRSTSAATRAFPCASAPCTTSSTPSGKTSPRTSAYACPQSGVSSEGLSTTPLPAISAGRTIQCGIIIGKFHGVIAAATPSASR